MNFLKGSHHRKEYRFFFMEMLQHMIREFPESRLDFTELRMLIAMHPHQFLTHFEQGWQLVFQGLVVSDQYMVDESREGRFVAIFIDECLQN